MRVPSISGPRPRSMILGMIASSSMILPRGVQERHDRSRLFRLLEEFRIELFVEFDVAELDLHPSRVHHLYLDFREMLDAVYHFEITENAIHEFVVAVFLVLVSWFFVLADKSA